MSSTLCLFCYVLGDGPSNIFPVDIEPSKTVAHLRDAIKAQKSPAFKDVDASTLKLWKVSIAVDSSFKERIDTSILVDEESLQPWDDLSDVFSELLAEEHVHVVVRPPFDGGIFFYNVILLVNIVFMAPSANPSYPFVITILPFVLLALFSAIKPSELLLWAVCSMIEKSYTR